LDGCFQTRNACWKIVAMCGTARGDRIFLGGDGRSDERRNSRSQENQALNANRPAHFGPTPLNELAGEGR
jgi:hypothetical protein